MEKRVQDYSKEILKIIRSNTSPAVMGERLQDYHENDLADVMPKLTVQERCKLYRILDTDMLSDIFEYTDEENAAEYLNEMDVKKAAAILSRMETDALADVLNKVEKTKKKILIDLLEPEVRRDVEMIASFDEDEIGSRMTTNCIVIRENLTVKQAMSELVKQAGENDNISVLYVVDENEHFYGAIDLKDLIIRAISSSKGLGNLKIHITDEDIEAIAAFSGGDARFCLNTLEMVVYNSPSELDGIHVSQDILKQCLQKRSLLYDKKGEEHYNIISALHKSVRNSDVQAAVYWLARMLEAGEDPLYIARRFVRMASEDIGMADSRALEICVAAYQACHYLGVPECNVHLTHAAVYLALAPKSNALEVAYNNAKSDALKTLDQPVPLHIRNAPTKLMKDLGYSKGYEYSHDYEYHMTDMQCLPDALVGKEYYVPSDQGSEVKVRNRLAQIKQIKAMVHRNRMMKKK